MTAGRYNNITRFIVPRPTNMFFVNYALITGDTCPKLSTRRFATADNGLTTDRLKYSHLCSRIVFYLINTSHLS